MKRKVLSILLVGFLIIGLTGCGSTNIDSENISLVKNAKDTRRFGDYTFEEVLKKGDVKDIKWEESGDDTIVVVTMTGTMKDGKEIKVLYYVRNDKSIWYKEFYINGDLQSVSKFDSLMQEYADSNSAVGNDKTTNSKDNNDKLRTVTCKATDDENKYQRDAIFDNNKLIKYIITSDFYFRYKSSDDFDSLCKTWENKASEHNKKKGINDMVKCTSSTKGIYRVIEYTIKDIDDEQKKDAGILDYFNSNGNFDESAWRQAEEKMSYNCN